LFLVLIINNYVWSQPMSLFENGKRLFLCFTLSVPVQSVMCRMGCKPTNLTLSEISGAGCNSWCPTTVPRHQRP